MAAREEQSINCKETPIRLSADCSAETLLAKGEWKDIFKVLKGKKMATYNTLSSKNII